MRSQISSNSIFFLSNKFHTPGTRFRTARLLPYGQGTQCPNRSGPRPKPLMPTRKTNPGDPSPSRQNLSVPYPHLRRRIPPKLALFRRNGRKHSPFLHIIVTQRLDRAGHKIADGYQRFTYAKMAPTASPAFRHTLKDGRTCATMRRATVGTILMSLAAWYAFGQTPDAPAKFEIADVHVSAKSVSQLVRTAPPRGGRYEVKNATMVDLIRMAFGYDPDKIPGRA